MLFVDSSQVQCDCASRLSAAETAPSCNSGGQGTGNNTACSFERVLNIHNLKQSDVAGGMTSRIGDQV